MVYTVGGLGEGSRHVVRCRCRVPEGDVDATLSWSPAVTVCTDVSVEVGCLLVGICGGGVSAVDCRGALPHSLFPFCYRVFCCG